MHHVLLYSRTGALPANFKKGVKKKPDPTERIQKILVGGMKFWIRLNVN